MSIIPLLYRRNKLVSIDIRSSSLDYDKYALEINLKDDVKYLTELSKPTYVYFLFLFIQKLASKI